MASLCGANTGNPKKAEHLCEETEEIGQQVPTVDNRVQLTVAGKPIRQDRCREEGSTESSPLADTLTWISKKIQTYSSYLLCLSHPKSG